MPGVLKGHSKTAQGRPPPEGQGRPWVQSYFLTPRKGQPNMEENYQKNLINLIKRMIAHSCSAIHTPLFGCIVKSCSLQ